MAFSGQYGTHPPHPLQPVSLMTAAGAVAGEAHLDRAVRAGVEAQAARGARVGVDDRDERVEFGEPLLEDDRALGHRGQSGGDALARVLRALAGAGDEHAVDDRLDRPQLRVDLVEEPVLVDRELEDADQLLVLARDHARDQDDEVGRDRQLFVARQHVAHGHQEAAGVGARHGRRGVVGELQVDRAELARLGVHRLELAVGAHVAVQVVLVHRRVLRGELDGRGDRGGAAVARAVLVGAGLSGGLATADAVDVGDAADRPAGVDQRTVGRVDERLELGQGHDPVDAVAVLADLRRVRVDAGGHDDRADLDRQGLRARLRRPGCRPRSSRSCRTC